MIKAFIVICVCLFTIGSCDEVKVINDGPVVESFPITLTAKYVPSKKNLNKTYTYKWEDDSFIPKRGEIESNKTKVSWQVTYDMGFFKVPSKAYTITVIVYTDEDKVATGKTGFNVTRFLNGDLIISQNNHTLTPDERFVSMNSPTDFLLKLHNSSGFLGGANVHYMWIVNYKQVYGPFSAPNISLNLSLAEEYRIQCQASAYFKIDQDWLYKPGFFERNLMAKGPITHLNITGKFFLKHGEILDLEVVCDGTKEFTYCWKIFDGTYVAKGNETCQKNFTTTECQFPVIHYFSKPQIYSILVIVDNEISHIAKSIVINVYDVEKKPQLSTVIVPVSCTLVAIILVILGIAFYLQTRSRLNIEVADFDFGGSSGVSDSEPRGFSQMLKDDFNEWAEGVKNTFRRQEDRVRTVTDRLRSQASDKPEEQVSNNT